MALAGTKKVGKGLSASFAGRPMVSITRVSPSQRAMESPSGEASTAIGPCLSLNGMMRRSEPYSVRITTASRVWMN